jgi:hypothetical protein
MVLCNTNTYSWQLSSFARAGLCLLLPDLELFTHDTISNDDIPLEVRTNPIVVGFFLLMSDKFNDGDGDDANFSIDDSIDCEYIDQKYEHYFTIDQYADGYNNHETVTIDVHRYCRDVESKLEKANAEIVALRDDNAALRDEIAHLGRTSTLT